MMLSRNRETERSAGEILFLTAVIESSGFEEMALIYEDFNALVVK